MQRIAELRRERGWSQVKLGARADVNPSTVNQVERGLRHPNSTTLEKLAGALGVGVADLFPKAEAPSAKASPGLPDPEEEERRSHAGYFAQGAIDRHKARAEAAAAAWELLSTMPLEDLSPERWLGRWEAALSQALGLWTDEERVFLSRCLQELEPPERDRATKSIVRASERTVNALEKLAGRAKAGHVEGGDAASWEESKELTSEFEQSAEQFKRLQGAQISVDEQDD